MSPAPCCLFSDWKFFSCRCSYSFFLFLNFFASGFAAQTSTSGGNVFQVWFIWNNMEAQMVSLTQDLCSACTPDLKTIEHLPASCTTHSWLSLQTSRHLRPDFQKLWVPTFLLIEVSILPQPEYSKSLIISEMQAFYFLLLCLVFLIVKWVKNILLPTLQSTFLFCL